jgi:hypothetical protein
VDDEGRGIMERRTVHGARDERKFEARNPKSETMSKRQCSKPETNHT